MSKTNIRKNESLGSSASELQADFKEAHIRYNSLVSELALLTKSDLRIVFKSIEKQSTINGMKNKVNTVFENIENVLLDMADTHTELDEIVQNVGGLEFATNNVVDKLAEILRDQEKQQARMTLEITNMKDDFEKKYGKEDKVDGFLEDLEEFLLEFSRFQDYVQDAVPRISRVFDELDREAEIGRKYGKTNKI